jgi:Tfp pilus assembly protein PilF
VGKHHVTFHNQGLCHYSLGQLDVALGLFKKALTLNSDYEKARSWIEKVEREMLAMLGSKISSISLQEHGDH